MRPGTAGFVGARLIEAREARGVTASSLAEMIGVTRQAVSKYENGKQTPDPEVFDRISSVLNVPRGFFTKVERRVDTSTIYYRSMSSATKTARTQVERRLWWLHDLASALETHLELPDIDVPGLTLPDDPAALSVDAIEGAAEEVRRAWGLGEGPISNVVWLLENHGIVVAKLPMAAELDGLSTWIGDRPFVALNSEVTACRSTFDAAHELGHLVLHRHVAAKDLVDGAKFKHLETQAHRFAGAFCFPARSFAREVAVPTLESFAALKKRWRVSIKMMIHRAKDLGLVSDARVVSMYRGYNFKKWHLGEPHDNEMLHEQPRLLSRCVATLDEHGVMSKADVLHLSGLSPTDLGSIAGTSASYFEPPKPVEVGAPALRPRVIPFRPAPSK